MTERRIDHLTRKRVAEMSPEEMRRALLISEKTGLPNRRAFDEGETSPRVAGKGGATNEDSRNRGRDWTGVNRRLLSLAQLGSRRTVT